jgi:hypothetical protein
MSLRVVGAGLPRTGTSSLGHALEYLLHGPRLHMSAIPGHPFDLGDGWRRALADEPVDWHELHEGYIAAVDWPSSMFWQELSARYPDAIVILSVREDAKTWLESMNATVLPVARMALDPAWSEGRDLVTLFERFAGTPEWDDPDILKAAYERHSAEVRDAIPGHRLVEWRAQDGWASICAALDLDVPDIRFPWLNKREDWGTIQ